MRILSLALALILPVLAVAGDITAVGTSVTVATNAPKTATVDIKSVTGKFLSLAIDITAAPATGQCAIASVAGTGSSIGGAKTILGSKAMTADLSSNATPTVYLYNDTLRVSVSNSWTNDVTLDVNIILER